MNGEESKAIVEAIGQMGNQISSRIAGVDTRLSTMSESISGVRERLGGIDATLIAHGREFKDLKLDLKDTTSKVTDMRSWVPGEVGAEIDRHKRDCSAAQAKAAEVTAVVGVQRPDASSPSRYNSFFGHQEGLFRRLLYIGLILGGLLAGAGVTVTIGECDDPIKSPIKIESRDQDARLDKPSNHRDMD